MTATRNFLGDPTSLSNGIAFSAKAIGNIARPYFPDGIVGSANGPLAPPMRQWSPFSHRLCSWT